MNSIEQQLLVVWQGIIHSNAINPQDSFLDQGGNSLHFIKLASLASQTFEIAISPSDIFTAGNLTDLATIIGQRRDNRV